MPSLVNDEESPSVMRVLALDIGNSNIKVGVFSMGRLLRFWRIKTDSTSPETVTAQVQAFLEKEIINGDFPAEIYPKGLVYCNVVPELEQAILKPLMTHFQITDEQALAVIPRQVDLPIDLGAYPAEQLGPDRLVNVCAAHYLFPDKNALIVDFGTATTFDLVDREGCFLGGVIAPGLETFWNILAEKTSRLADVSWHKPNSVLGKNTNQCMQAGLSAGYAGLYAETLRQIQVELPDMDFLILGTGGLAESFQELTNQAFKMDHVDPWLTLKGLYQIYKHQQKAF